MMKNHDIISQEILCLKIIHYSHSLEGDKSDLVLFTASKVLCLKGYEFVKKCYENSPTIIYQINAENTVSFYDLKK